MGEVGSGHTRRAVVLGAGAIGVAAGAGLLAGCDDGSEDGGADDPKALAQTNEIPVGGGVVRRKIIVAQPAAGVFTAFDAVCTHAGCTVSQPKDGVAQCGCHDSRFSMKDGSVVGGPATTPLRAVPITVKGDTIIEE
jgi:Rieske Fe-S protein